MDSHYLKPTEIQPGDPFGVVPVRPISNLPQGVKLKIRMRDSRVAEAFVREGKTVTRWSLWNDGNGGWKLDFPLGQNATIETAATSSKSLAIARGGYSNG